MSDLIDRQAAISYAISGRIRTLPTSEDGENWIRTSEVRQSLLTMPSAQPEPISEAYAKAVYAWLLNYQIKAAEMEGRYIPCEVLSWVANDWRKENEID